MKEVSVQQRAFEPAERLVTWDGPDDPDHPQNWKRSRKWAAIAIVSAYTLMSPVASSIIAPSIQAIGKGLAIESESEKSLCLSIFVLGFAFGPLVLGPLSEMYGRSNILQVSNILFLVFNTAGGFSRTKAQLVACRFFGGIGGSTPLALGPATLVDLFAPEERGLAAGIYSFMPIMGPAIGPICGGFITDYGSWRWGFWGVSIANVPILLLGMLLLEETYAPTLLKRRRDSLAEKDKSCRWITEYKERAFLPELTCAVVRPLRLMTTQVIIIVMELYQAYLYGLMYIFLTTFPTLWRERYAQSDSVGSLNYISLGLGYSLGILASGRLQNLVYIALKRRNSDVGRPKFRIPLLLPVSALLLPLGFLLYGWAAERTLHWAITNIGAFIFAGGIMMGFNALMTYVLDSYTTYAASAAAATAVLRSVAAFLLPLGAGDMYKALGWGWGNTLLGGLAIGLGLPAAICIWVWGERLRERSTFAKIECSGRSPYCVLV